jgi:hypothetical protein
MQVSYASTTNSSAMRKRFNSLLFSIILLFIFIAAQTNAQTQNYRSAGNGNWNNPGTWEVESPAGSGNWTGTSSVPNTANDTVLIRNGHTVTINIPLITIRRLVVGEGTSGVLQFDNGNRTLNIGAGGVIVNAGGTFQFGNAAQTLTVNNGGSVIVNGTFQFGNAPQTLTVNGGSVQVNAGGTFQVTSAPPSTTHTINITGGGSFTNDGTVNFRIVSGGITDVANLNLSGNLAGTGTSTFNNITFNGTNNQTITIGGTVAINGTVQPLPTTIQAQHRIIKLPTNPQLSRMQA